MNKSEVRKELEELKVDIDNLVNPLNESLDMYKCGFTDEVDLEALTVQQNKVLNYLREVSQKFADDLAMVLEKNDVLTGVLMLQSMENEVSKKTIVN